MSCVISIGNAKGGVGKTTTSVNLCAALVEHGFRVCLIDNDPQGQSTKALGYPSRQLKYTLTNLMFAVLNEMELDDCIDKCILTEGVIHCIPSNHRLNEMAKQLAVKQVSGNMFGNECDSVKTEFVLKKIIEHINIRYDYIIIDCGPSMDLLTINAFAASNRVIIPTQAHYLPEEGLDVVLETIKAVQANLNPDLEISGILLTFYQSTTNLCKSVREDIIERYGKNIRIFTNPIAHSIKVAEHPAFNKSIFEHDPNNPAASGYRKLAREVLEYGETVIAQRAIKKTCC